MLFSGEILIEANRFEDVESLWSHRQFQGGGGSRGPTPTPQPPSKYTTLLIQMDHFKVQDPYCPSPLSWIRPQPFLDPNPGSSLLLWCHLLLVVDHLLPAVGGCIKVVRYALTIFLQPSPFYIVMVVWPSPSNCTVILWPFPLRLPWQ